MSMPAKLRRLIAENRPLWTGGVHDALSTKLASEAGFDLLNIGGYQVCASQYGLPDAGLITMAEVLDVYRRSIPQSAIPVIADGENGFGNAVMVMRTVREFERVGLAGVQLEDQVAPRSCPWLQTNELVTIEEGVGKIRAALAARTNPDFLIRARTDAPDIEEAIRRGRAYAEAGADVIYGINKSFRNYQELLRFKQEIGRPVGFSVVGWAESLTQEQIQSLGCCFVNFPFPVILTVAETLKQTYEALLRTKSPKGLPFPMMKREDLDDLMGFPAVSDASRAYVPQPAEAAE